MVLKSVKGLTPVHPVLAPDLAWWTQPEEIFSEKQFMQEAEEQGTTRLAQLSAHIALMRPFSTDTCRICSAPAEPDQPLFHPCKCSGTIRYIHQDCLTTWLAHSKKKTCETCRHQYSFTKVYASDMPSTLPPLLMMRRLLQQGFYASMMVVRAVVVSLVWLSLVPLLTVWSWRVYFSMGDSIAWWVSNRQPFPDRSELSPTHKFFVQEIYELSQSIFDDPTAASDYTLLGRAVRHPAWISLSADVFSGQIIAALIVITFVAIFFLREWIAQNARPGQFDDEDENAILQVPPVPEPILPPAPVVPRRPAAPRHVPRPGVQRMDVNARLALAHRQFEAVKALDSMKDRDLRFLSEEEKKERELQAQRNGQSSVSFAPLRSDEFDEEFDLVVNAKARRRRLGKGKGKEREDKDGEEEMFVEILRAERLKRRKFNKRLHLARQNGSHRRLDVGQGQENNEPVIEDPSEPKTTTRTPSPPSSFFPPVALERPNGTIPFSFVYPPPVGGDSPSTASPSLASKSDANVQSPPSFSASLSNTPNHDIPLSGLSLAPPPSFVILNSSSNASTSLPGTPIRRPPLPTTLPSSPGAGPSSSSVKTPLASPSLATYRAPEELEGEGYFAGTSINAPSAVNDESTEDDDDDDTETLDGHEADSTLASISDSVLSDEEEMATYFREQLADDGDNDHGPGPEPLNRLDADGLNPQQQRAGPPALVFGNGNVNGAAEPDEDEDEEEEEDEDGDEGEEDMVDDIQRPQRPPHGAILAFDAGGVRRAGPLDVNAPLQLGPPGPPQLMQGPQPANADDAFMDDLEAGVEDDMEGALEAIGLRGPIYGLLQNAALMIFIMDTVIGLGIWIPYTLGKSMAFLLLEPRQLFFILHLPIRAIRLLTDPAVDLVAYFIVDVILPPPVRIIKTLLSWIARSSLWLISESLGEAKAHKASESSQALSNLLEASYESCLRAVGLLGNDAEEIVTANSEAIVRSPLSEALGVTMNYIEPIFAPIGRELRHGYTQLSEVWTKLAVGNGPVERIFSVLFGYCIIATGLAIYMNILTMSNVKTAGRAVRVAVKQQLLVLKVASFIFIELVTFPLGCGVVLDICTIWLFPNASYASRIDFLYQAPLTTIFYHWVAGTMFMYSFAVMLSGCRSIMRPGGMWFIKDPQDQNAHPIRDILERAALVQLRKICISGLMYTFVVVCTVCSVYALLTLGRTIVLPFRWKTREPLSNIPVDLLFLNLALPYTMTYFRPRRALRKFTMAVWKGLAKRLRLTSYFFGTRHAEEEYTPKKWSLSRFFYGPKQDPSVTLDDYDGSFRRVPNTDDLAIPRDIPATVAVTVTGEPFDEEAERLMIQQDMATVKAKHNIKHDFTVVYLPPHFRYRMIFFIFVLWVFGALFLGLSLALPILIGRGFFGIVFKGKREVHDGYSLLAGFYMLWACWVVGKAVDRLDKRRQRWATEGPRASLWWLALKRGLLWALKASYMAFFFGVVIPVLVGGVVELYIVLPFKLRLNVGSGVPRIRVLECWATGLLYMKIAMRVIRRQGQNPIARGVQAIKRNGWTHPDPIVATKDVIAPVTGGLIGMITLPALVFLAVDYFFPLVGRHVNDKFLFTYVYSSLFCLAGMIHTFIILREMLASWSQAVRDKEFLVEMRLKNHDPKTESGTPTPSQTATPIPEDEAENIE
ncbi:hypothetical protein C8R42DRAFT_723411 [Lentinula raphanica]|nr:hypothetical protein C8R42DRAFT_723411 [Lentinula raphanica]